MTGSPISRLGSASTPVAGGLLLAVLAACSASSATSANNAMASRQAGVASQGAGVLDAGVVDAAGLSTLAPAPTDFVSETWQTDDGPVTLLKTVSGRLSMSASCKKPDGAIDCEAFTFVTQPVHVDLGEKNPHGASQGTLRCVKSHHILVSAHDAQGNQDGLCKFGDGSYTTVGSIESRANP